MVLIPNGIMARSLCSQWNSISLHKLAAKSVLGLACMKSTMCSFMSDPPWWSFRLKCFPTSDFGEGELISVQWAWNLCNRVFLVWPTYCLLHTLQLMQYMMLLNLHVTFDLAEYDLPVALLTILPLLSRFSQYFSKGGDNVGYGTPPQGM